MARATNEKRLETLVMKLACLFGLLIATLLAISMFLIGYKAIERGLYIWLTLIVPLFIATSLSALAAALQIKKLS